MQKSPFYFFEVFSALTPPPAPRQYPPPVPSAARRRGDRAGRFPARSLGRGGKAARRRSFAKNLEKNLYLPLTSKYKYDIIHNVKINSRPGLKRGDYMKRIYTDKKTAPELIRKITTAQTKSKCFYNVSVKPVRGKPEKVRITIG